MRSIGRLFTTAISSVVGRIMAVGVSRLRSVGGIALTYMIITVTTRRKCLEILFQIPTLRLVRANLVEYRGSRNMKVVRTVQLTFPIPSIHLSRTE